MNIEEALFQIKQNIKMHKIDGTTSNQNEREKALLEHITNLQESEAYYYGYYKDYKSRNEKAIEYIKQNSKCGGSFIDNKFVIEYIDEIFNGMELLNILNGDDE